MEEVVREVTCILCPVSCRARVTIHEKEMKVENIECPRGEDYVLKEVKQPERDFFTVVRIVGATLPVLPVRATKPLPKEKILDCVAELANVEVSAPVRLGDVIVKNILGLGADIVAARDLPGATRARTREGRI
jgi:CxxC motif-containing protein